MDTSSTNPYASPLTDANCPPRVHRTFCGLQPWWTKPDRFYKIYITEAALYAGWIGGQFHDKLSVRYQLSPLYLVLVGFLVAEPIAAWTDYRRRCLQSLYDSLIVDPNRFLAADRRNFVLGRKSIQSIKVSLRKSYWTLWANRGIMDVVTDVGAPIRIIVRDARDLGTIVDELAAAGYPVEVAA